MNSLRGSFCGICLTVITKVASNNLGSLRSTLRKISYSDFENLSFMGPTSRFKDSRCEQFKIPSLIDNDDLTDWFFTKINTS